MVRNLLAFTLVGFSAIAGAAVLSASVQAQDPTTPSMPTEPTVPAAEPTAPAAQSSPLAAPSEEGDIIEVASQAGSFQTLTQALTAAGLVETLKGEGPFTVFAPTDEAFAALPEGTLAELLKPENKEQLVKILTYHVVPGEAVASSLKDGEVQTVEGAAVTVKIDPAKQEVMVNDAKVITPDVTASNGVIHVIDKVILPPDS
jgi:uncharacterized surface protein with fasciclin (FAS1) repeats